MVVVFEWSESRAQDSICVYMSCAYLPQQWQVVTATVAGCDCNSGRLWLQQWQVVTARIWVVFAKGPHFCRFLFPKRPDFTGFFAKQTWRFYRELWGLFCFVCVCTCVSVPVFIPVSVSISVSLFVPISVSVFVPISVSVFVPISVSVFVPISVPISVSVPACQNAIRACNLLQSITTMYINTCK